MISISNQGLERIAKNKMPKVEKIVEFANNHKFTCVVCSKELELPRFKTQMPDEKWYWVCDKHRAVN